MYYYCYCSIKMNNNKQVMYESFIFYGNFAVKSKTNERSMRNKRRENTKLYVLM